MRKQAKPSRQTCVIGRGHVAHEAADLPLTVEEHVACARLWADVAAMRKPAEDKPKIDR